MANPEPIPGDPLVVVGKSFIQSSWMVTSSWYDWLLNLATIVLQAARRLATISLDGQAASIAPTTIIAGKPGGLFRVTVYARITQKATTGSGLSVTIAFLDGGHAVSFTTGLIVDGDVTSALTQSFTFEADQSFAATYATTYTSTGGTPMNYKLRIVAESMS